MAGCLVLILSAALPWCAHGLRAQPQSLMQTQHGFVQRRHQGLLARLRRGRRSRQTVDDGDFDSNMEEELKAELGNEIAEDTRQDVEGKRQLSMDPFEVLWRAAQKGGTAAAKALSSINGVPPLALPIAGGALMTSNLLTGAAAVAAAPVMAVGAAAMTAATGAAAGAGATGAVAASASAMAAAKTAQALIDISDPDVGVEMEELVRRRGYPIERHRVVTQDGYVLIIFRIPHGREEDARTRRRQRRPAVLLQHGVLDSSLAFVANFHNQSLGYILADAGYDVWLGNNRGNRYSKGHTLLSPLSSQFWDFSWQEMAEFDLPAEVDYILKQTGEKKVAYIGHSEGTIQAFAGLSSSAFLSSRISVMVALGPVAFTNTQRVLFFKAAQKLGMDKFLRVLGEGVLSQGIQTMNAIMPIGCRAVTSGCSMLIDSLAGKSSHLNQSRMHVYLTMFPAGSSTKNIRHWVNSIKAKAFTKYDYGSNRENFRHYGSNSPPVYDLSNISVPIALLSGGNDMMADPEDVMRLKNSLRPEVVFKFMEAQDANELLYPEVLDALQRYSP